MISLGLAGCGLVTSSHSSQLLFCLLLKAFLMWDTSGQQTCSPQLLTTQFWGKRKRAALIEPAGTPSWVSLSRLSLTLPKGPAPAFEPNRPLKRLAARFFQLSGPAPTAGSEPPSCPRASWVGMLVSPRNSVMFFLRRAWPWQETQTDKTYMMYSNKTENETNRPLISNCVISRGKKRFQSGSWKERNEKCTKTG